MNEDFDKGIIYFIRNLTKAFLINNRGRSINGLPIELAAIVEEDPKVKSLDDYITNILMKM